MKINDFQKNCVGLLASQEGKLENGALGLCGEAGEVADLVKKHIFHGHELNHEKLKLELGDVLFYVSIVTDSIGLTLQEVIDANVEKLAKRYSGGKFTKEESLRKADENN